MAYLDQPQQDESLEQPGQATGGVGGTIGGDSTKPTSPRGSGAWTNLQAYTKANQPQGERMAQQVGQNLTSAGQGVGEQIKQSSDAYSEYLQGMEPTKQQTLTEKIAGGYVPGETDINPDAWKMDTPTHRRPRGRRRSARGHAAQG